MHVVLVGPEFEENLSLRYLAAALRQSGHTASLARFDSTEYVDGVVQQVRREKPGIVGLSMVFQVRAREFFELARALRSASYTGHITAGGHFATFACESILGDVLEIDSIVRQEGEETLVEMATAIERAAEPAALAQIPGLVTRGVDGGTIAAPRRQQVMDLDTLPFPTRDTPPELHLGVPTAYLVGSRGCYADCDYCSIFAWHEAAVGKRYRMRTPANIADEMAFLYHERGVRFFVFHDDNFFLPTAAGNRKRFESLRDEIAARGIGKIGLMLKLRPNDCDRENMLLLKRMGLLRAFVGIENASDRQLKTLGRNSSVEDVQSCLALLRELDIYATFNILLFDPYTTPGDIAANLRFLREIRWFPFNWCKVEPYAGTALEKRYGSEGRLRGSYLGWDYEMDNPRVRLMYDLLLPAVYYRNFDYYGLANLNIGLGYHRQLLRHFYPERCSPEICETTQRVIESINDTAIELLERTLLFAREVDLADHVAIEQFGATLRRDSFRIQHQLSEQVEAALQAIERAAGVRHDGPVGVSEAFTPLLPADEPVQRAVDEARSQAKAAKRWRMKAPSSAHPAPDLARRGALATMAAGMLWVLSGCKHRPETPRNPPVEPVAAPQAKLQLSWWSPTKVKAGGVFQLEGILQTGDGQVVGSPRLTADHGKIKSVKTSRDRRAVVFDYLPAGGETFDPNLTVTVAWTVRRKTGDVTVIGRGFVHVNDDGSYAFGYQTPRPTIAEMAAPPIGGRGRRG